jgi:hypothetical protein
MHDRHWVGRNRGKNLKCVLNCNKLWINVKPYVEESIFAGTSAFGNVIGSDRLGFGVSLIRALI